MENDKYSPYDADIAEQVANYQDAKRIALLYDTYIKARNAYDSHIRHDPDNLARTPEAEALARQVHEAHGEYTRYCYGW